MNTLQNMKLVARLISDIFFTHFPLKLGYNYRFKLMTAMPPQCDVQMG